MVLKACSSSEIRGHDEKAEVDVRDRLGELPDDILGHILSSLPTRDSVQTSSLAKRWRNVWNSVPIINIEDRNLNEECDQYNWNRCQSGLIDISFKERFMNFVDRVLLPSLNDELSCVRKIRLGCYNDYDLSRVRNWINVMTRLDHVEELDLSFLGDMCVQLPRRILTCKKLVILKLTKNVMLNFPVWFCLPSLKYLHLFFVTTLDADSVKNLLNGCPVLEELRIERHSDDEMKMETLYVQSSSLKSLTFYSKGFICTVHLLRMVIDATNLERLHLVVDGKTQIDVNNSLSSLITATLSVTNRYSIETDSYTRKLLELLMKMSNIKSLYLYLSSEVKLSLEHQRLEYLPMFKNLMHLEVGIFCCSWPILPCLLESSPNLTSFVLFRSKFEIELWGCQKPHRKSCTAKCFMLYLEKIRLSFSRGSKNEMELVSYFLKNAPVLKKLSISFRYITQEELSDLHGKVLKLPKASAACEIEVGWFFLDLDKGSPP